MIEDTLGKFCQSWALVEVKSPAMFKDASICSKECAKYSEKYGTCIDIALKEAKIQQILKR